MGMSMTSSPRLPVYSTATAATLAALTSMLEGDLCYQEDTKVWYTYDGAAWVQIISGAIIQTVTATATAGSGSTTTVFDNSIMQKTEGNEIITATITPTRTTNKLLIMCELMVASPNANDSVLVGLFQDATADAIATMAEFSGAADVARNMSLQHVMAAGTTSATTFKIRAGANQAGTFYWDRTSTVNPVGGAIPKTRLTIIEIGI